MIICNPTLALDLDFNQSESARGFNALGTNMKKIAWKTINSCSTVP
ncbi:MAG: hypothetical protein IPP78_11410 [Holophagaceae bacterium]|nr:hypothetical protein [Holophagaceae bacterium]